MGKILGMVRRHAVVAAVGVALLATGVGFGAAAVTGDDPGTREVADISTPTATVTVSPEAPPPATDAPAPVPGDTPGASIEPVTPDQPAPRAEDGSSPEAAVEAPEIPEGYDPAARFTDSAGTVYQPAPDVPVEPLPDEPGYVPPGD